MSTGSLVIGGIIAFFGILVIIFRVPLSKSHFITIPKGIGGKSFAEKFGEEKAGDYMAGFGLIFVIFGLIAALQV